MIVNETWQALSNLRLASLTLALSVCQFGMANAQDFEAVEVRLSKAVKAGELTPAQSRAMLWTLKEMKEHKENQKVKEREASYQKAVKEIKAAVKTGKISEKEAQEKAAELHAEFFGDHKVNDADYEAIAEQIREAVGLIINSTHEIESATEAGKISEEQAVHKLSAILSDLHGEQEKHQEPHGMEEPETEFGQITAEQVIASMDKDNDHMISRSEASAEVKPNFDAIDTNGDGMINVKEAQVMADYANKMYGSTETQPAPRANMEESLAAMDRNGDGKITKDEASEDLKLFFGKYDVNNDDVIDGQEAKKLEKYIKRAKTADKTSPVGVVTAAQIVSFMDKNNDQKISPDEASADLKPYFDSFDTNKDGLIDIKEAMPIAEYANNQRSSK